MLFHDNYCCTLELAALFGQNHACPNHWTHVAIIAACGLLSLPAGRRGKRRQIPKPHITRLYQLLLVEIEAAP